MFDVLSVVERDNFSYYINMIVTIEVYLYIVLSNIN